MLMVINLENWNTWVYSNCFLDSVIIHDNCLQSIFPLLVYRGKYIKAELLYTILQSISIITHCKINPGAEEKCVMLVH